MATLTSEHIQRCGAQLGYHQLNAEQLDVIRSFIQGKDCYFCAPTGFGKSVLFQIAPMVYDFMDKRIDSAVIVVVPTISLAIDACSKVEKLRPECVSVHLTKASLEVAKEATYIFCSLEAILDVDCERRLLKDGKFARKIRAVFVDESHIVKSW